jgi:hypothetical protein
MTHAYVHVSSERMDKFPPVASIGAVELTPRQLAFVRYCERGGTALPPELVGGICRAEAASVRPQRTRSFQDIKGPLLALAMIGATALYARSRR